LVSTTTLRLSGWNGENYKMEVTEQDYFR